MIYQFFTTTPLDHLRQRRFKKFTHKYIKIRKRKYMSVKRALKKLGKRYDLFLTGSDQVWNPVFAGDSRFFLAFAPPEKRIAFSASIGVDCLPEDKREKYRRWLQEMRFISVREKSAADLVEQLTGRRPEIWLDPTLLVDCAVWQQLVRRPKIEIPKQYILSFFLGEEPKEMLMGYERELRMPVIRLEDKSYPQYYTIDPAEFLYLIKQAKLVLTDSFHATVFSIKFHVPFFVFQRQQAGGKNMFTRIEYLLERFRLMDRCRERNWNKGYATWQEITEAQYAEIEAQINLETQKIEESLKSILVENGHL